MSVRHVHARKGEYIKVHRDHDDRTGCFAALVIVVLLVGLFGC